MISYFEKADRQLVFRERPEFPHLTDADKSDISQHWQIAKAANPTGLFDSQIFSCNEVLDDGTSLTLGVNKVNYSTYKWARDNGKQIPGTYAMGNGILLHDPDRQSYVLLERSGNTAFDAGRVSAIGGVLDYQEGVVGNMMEYVKAQTLKKVAEEVTTRGNYVWAVGYLGAYVDDATHKVEFVFEGSGCVMGVKADENKAVVEVKPKDLSGFVNNHEARMEKSTLVHLQHWAPKLAVTKK